MRTLWHGLVRIVFWSFERGTWPYDVAVALIVVFVLLSPRSWFSDRAPLDPPAATAPAAALVEMRGTDPADGAEIYRVDARMLSSSGGSAKADLEGQLFEAVRKNAKHLRSSNFEIVRIASVRGHDGEIAYYDVCVRP
jgi:hypothetical protein